MSICRGSVVKPVAGERGPKLNDPADPPHRVGLVGHSQRLVVDAFRLKTEETQSKQRDFPTLRSLLPSV
jgi:hypothetical protein